MICPYCGNEKVKKFYSMNMPVFLSVVSAGQKFCDVEKFEASLCLRCGLAFNSNPLPKNKLDEIYSSYRYIQPHKGIGISKYNGFASLVQDYVPKTKHLVEIGSADGYLLDLLFSKGYSLIEGFEPSQEFLSSKNKSKIRNDFFGEETLFSSQVDAFMLMHVLEHFSSPQDILRHMRKNLSFQGKILFEVPNFRGFHHQHLLFFSLTFIKRMAKELGFKLLYSTESDTVLRVVLEKIEEFEKHKESLSAGFFEGLAELEKRVDQIQSHNTKILASVEEVLHKSVVQGVPVYWWGSGSTSIIVLANIDADLLAKSTIVLLDNDFDRQGFVLPLVAMQENPVCYAQDYLNKIKEEDFLVIASEFFQEIIEDIKDKCTLPRNILPINIY